MRVGRNWKYIQINKFSYQQNLQNIYIHLVGDENNIVTERVSVSQKKYVWIYSSSCVASSNFVCIVVWLADMKEKGVRGMCIACMYSPVRSSLLIFMPFVILLLFSPDLIDSKVLTWYNPNSHTKHNRKLLLSRYSERKKNCFRKRRTKLYYRVVIREMINSW